MSQKKIYRRDNPKAPAKTLTGVEKCPRCGALQDLKDRFVTIKFYDKIVKCWSCHACGHGFRTCDGQILGTDQWPIINRDGYRVELKDE